MGGRYYLTGVQLGMLVSDDKEVRLSTMQDIIDNQFIGNADEKDNEMIKLIDKHFASQFGTLNEAKSK